MYNVDRDVLVNMFSDVFREYFLDDFINLFMGTSTILTDGYVFVHQEDDYYIVRLKDGFMLRWYKHLGRMAETNMYVVDSELYNFIRGVYKSLEVYRE